jgi:hypothetical protein
MLRLQEQLHLTIIKTRQALHHKLQFKKNRNGLKAHTQAKEAKEQAQMRKDVKINSHTRPSSKILATVLINQTYLEYNFA